MSQVAWRFSTNSILRLGLVLTLGLGLGLGATAQKAAPTAKPAATAPTGGGMGGTTGAAGADAAPKAGALPTEFRGIKLGMGLEEVQALLAKDSLFQYRGPEDVSLLPTRNQSLLEASGTSFVKRAFFQFKDGKLWVMIFMLNPDKIDHFSIYSSLTAKYGEPAIMGPKEARWEDKTVRVALERPLTLRYMDMGVYADLEAGGEAQAGAEELARRDFLGGL